MDQGRQDRLRLLGGMVRPVLLLHGENKLFLFFQVLGCFCIVGNPLLLENLTNSFRSPLAKIPVLIEIINIKH